MLPQLRQWHSWQMVPCEKQPTASSSKQGLGSRQFALGVPGADIKDPKAWVYLFSSLIALASTSTTSEAYEAALEAAAKETAEFLKMINGSGASAAAVQGLCLLAILGSAALLLA
eukprot:scaffold96517_cov16-Tisochrysis_lutea.AAC.2